MAEAKRGRGRPKKSSISTTATQVQTTSSKGRGRPRKDAMPAENVPSFIPPSGLVKEKLVGHAVINGKKEPLSWISQLFPGSELWLVIYRDKNNLPTTVTLEKHEIEFIKQ